jgi:hypothetical protein
LICMAGPTRDVRSHSVAMAAAAQPQNKARKAVLL